MEIVGTCAIIIAVCLGLVCLFLTTKSDWAEEKWGSSSQEWRTAGKVGIVGSIIILCIGIYLCGHQFTYSSGSKTYYDNKGRAHATQSDADVWNDVDEWMDKNW